MSSFWDDLGVVLGLFWGHIVVMLVNFGVILESCWGHSLTLRVVAVDPDEPLPCYVVPCVFWSVLFSIGT